MLLSPGLVCMLIKISAIFFGKNDIQTHLFNEKKQKVCFFYWESKKLSILEAGRELLHWYRPQRKVVDHEQPICGKF